ncbi:MAG: ribosome assembly cofactor RimP [Bacteroidales bacterium]|jgi:ribosome maturation factor RimP|nr:ribosome assembly cofactor RimP [Bacteroidales bacterium]
MYICSGFFLTNAQGTIRPFFIIDMESVVTKERITQLVEQFIAGSDLFLVDITVSPTAQISVAIDSGQGVDIDRCVALSRHIEGNLNREEEDFELTVASAGLSEPFKVYRQYEKNKGRYVAIVLTTGEKFVGTLLDVTPDEVQIEYEETVKAGPKGKKKKVITQKTITFADIKRTTVEISMKSNKTK